MAEAVAEETRKKADAGLSSFKLNPGGMSGLELFEHQVAFRQRTFGDEDQKISAHLDVSPRNKHQRDMMTSDFARKVQHNIMKEIGASGGTERLAQRKIDALGYIKSHSCFINDPQRMEKLKSKLELARSLERVKAIEDEEAVVNRKNEEGEHRKLLPEAIKMFKEGAETKKFGKKFTKAAISAILLLCYNLKVSGNKDPMMKALNEAYEKDLSKLEVPVGI